MITADFQELGFAFDSMENLNNRVIIGASWYEQNLRNEAVRSETFYRVWSIKLLEYLISRGPGGAMVLSLLITGC